jgi:hypothetical protein
MRKPQPTSLSVFALVLALGSTAAAPAARGDEEHPGGGDKPGQVPAADSAASTDGQGEGKVVQPPQLNFDFFGDASKPALLPSPEDSAREDAVAVAVQKRRHRLNVHQVLGLGTWATMLAASVVGQLNYHDLYGGGSGRGNYILPHQILVYSTTALFATTAAYALLAPNPYPKPLKADTALVHRLAAIGASAGMVAQVVLGFITARSADAGNADHLARNAKIHDVIGWTTFGFMTVAGATWVF